MENPEVRDLKKKDAETMNRASVEPEMENVTIDDAFWSRYQSLVAEKVLPYQWEALNDRVPEAERSHAVANFRVAAGLEKGDFHGWVFQDSDVFKWLETLGHSLGRARNPELEKAADELIGVIGKAQQPDGYLNTYFTVKEPGKRWNSLREAHELYCAGHLFEAAAAYYESTGKRQVLDIACRFADHIDRTFGPEEGKLKGYCGHPEIELALVKLYQSTGEERYLTLSRYFIDQRGQKPSYFEEEAGRPGHQTVWSGMKDYDLAYSQCKTPIREQDSAEGHAVRAVYLYAAVADLARLTGDEGLKRTTERIWESITQRKMYVTGGIGSTAHGEAFTGDYDLPNDSAYAETCAAIGLVFFAQRMLKLEADNRYGDVLELALYNGALSGMAQDGKSYFYVNPLEVRPRDCATNPGLKHVKPRRQPWYGCACCPPNLARLIASLGKYLYTVKENRVYAHLYVGSRAQFSIPGGAVTLTQQTGYPYEGAVKFRISAPAPITFTLNLRIPGWCQGWRCDINGENLKAPKLEKGYLKLERLWQEGDCIELSLEMPVVVLRSNPKVAHNAGKLALQRGPLVYCVEEADNGPNLHGLHIPKDARWEANLEPGLLGGTTVIRGKALRMVEENEELYFVKEPQFQPVEVVAVPYFLWCNRKPGEMRVWLNEAAGHTYSFHRQQV